MSEACIITAEESQIWHLNIYKTHLISSQVKKLFITTSAQRLAINTHVQQWVSMCFYCEWSFTNIDSNAAEASLTTTNEQS